MVAPDRERLRRAFGRAAPAAAAPADPAAADPAAAAAPAVPALRQFLQQRRPAFTAPPRPKVALPPAVVEATPHGPLWRRELRYPLAHRHGQVPLAAALQLDGERLAALAKDPAFAALDPRQCLFLDTETTGLSGGVGTVVFNYGLGCYRGEEFVVEQLFLRDFGEEPALLHHVAQRLAEFPVLVTFVGKSYDRHRIHARLVLHKVAAPVLTARHLDLYHVVRRSHGKQLPDTRLATVERQLLGLCRDQDLPGSEAPVAFLQWVRDQTGPVDRVLEHNRLDVLSLAALLGLLAGRCAQVSDRAAGAPATAAPRPPAPGRSPAR